MKCSKQLSDKMLTYKVTILMALTSASRVSALHHLDIRYMVLTETQCTFTFSKLHKSWKKGATPPAVTFYAYKANENLCVVSTIKEYINRTKEWRIRDNQSQLLLSFINPHREVVSSTIAGSIKNLLCSAGINTEVFKAHSTRSASTSKAGASDLSLPDVMVKWGSWSNESTWQKFYNKKVATPEEKFQSYVFNTL